MPKRNREAGLAEDLPEAWKVPKKQSMRKDASELPPEDGTTVVTGSSTPSETTKPSRSSRTSRGPKVAGTAVLKPLKKLAVGLDFGTTFTGVAFAMTGTKNLQDVQVISNWSGGMGRNDELEKVPSCIAYQDDERNQGLKEDCFGYEVESGMRSYHWTKLLLDDLYDPSEYDNPYFRKSCGQGLLRLPEGGTATKVSADILRFVYKHAMKTFEETFSRRTLELTPIEFRLTYPATWSLAARHATMEAARTAGFGSRKGDDVIPITEPEAAAIAILSYGADANSALFKQNATVLVCDMGGGTIDMQCLTITAKKCLKATEPCEGEGGKAGSTYIDCNFYQWMRDTFGKAFTDLPDDKVSASSRFMSNWELIKRSFDGKYPEKIYRIPFPILKTPLRKSCPNHASYDFRDTDILVKGSDLAAMFDPTIAATIGLIKSQRDKLKQIHAVPFSVIALCGGLGGSEFIYRKLHTFCDEEFGDTVALLKDRRPWSSVVRGAAICGLRPNFVEVNRSKKHFGIGVYRVFDPEEDREEDSFICSVTGNKCVGGYVQYAVKKGNAINHKRRYSTGVYAAVDINDPKSNLQFTWDLYSCAADNASNRIDGEDVKYEAEIQLDLSNAFKGFSPETLLPGAVAGPARINIVFKPLDDRGNFDVQALHERKRVGRTTLDFTRCRRRPAGQVVPVE